MQFLHVTDIHFDKSIFNWISKRAGDFDAVCLTGDFMSEAGENEGSPEKQIARMLSWLEDLPKPVFMCSGNHDVLEPDLSMGALEALFVEDEEYMEFSSQPEMPQEETWLSKIGLPGVYTDGAIVDLDGVKIGCMPYQGEDHYKFQECDVLLCHVPPAKTKVSIGQFGDYGCPKLRRSLQTGLLKPTYLLSGHIHIPVSNTDKVNGVNLVNPGWGNWSSEPRHAIIEV
ncbi:hypothetical protein A9Q83_04185 [Alphaproteobacteria bacterium 46_93_T64]|nr:hypothetical protein A9Q83_04185 [Alphaproteobacteria bacterium 46_93_T64]